MRRLRKCTTAAAGKIEDAGTDSAPRRTKAGRKPEPEFFTVSDVAARLACSTKSVRRRVGAGLINARREGGRLLVPRGEYFAYIAGLRGPEVIQ